MPVRAIHVALDVTDRVLDEAEAAGANLVVTHHPLMFHARKRLVETDREARLLCRMIRANMALISAHTNFDLAPDGTGRALAQALSLEELTAQGFVWVGTLPVPMTGEALARPRGGGASHRRAALWGHDAHRPTCRPVLRRGRRPLGRRRWRWARRRSSPGSCPITTPLT